MSELSLFRSIASLRNPFLHQRASFGPMSVPRRSSRISAQLKAPPPHPGPPAKKRKREATPEAVAEERIDPVTPDTRKPGALPRETVARLADPTATNATLVSPETSRLVTSRRVRSESPSSSTTRAQRKTTTTDNLLQEACKHLIKVDERLRPLIEKNPCHIFSPQGLAEKVDPFESLASGIISQQVSGAAARSIKAKFVSLFDLGGDGVESRKRFPPPSEVAACRLERLRTAGLSQRKAEYIQGLAGKFVDGELSAQMLREAPYEELVERLVAVRGLGRWSVEMFACFGLKRMDVFSVGDLGVQRGMAAFVGRDVAKLKKAKGGGNKWKYMSERDMLELSARFAPYRSLFMWLMWRVEDSFTDVSSME
ncbi:hypothetical protein L249_1529 [Ophiocordyceps polyrhachis-furcata BCC 54312]|uniref:HhH-GPD domain-containing protein n=1 Tax=Ophiocordyceps polyrhachis-furcata BCC 54312 TaxID=1330021 RepID=A0A367L415_9HYPO|nr:hypothetical protein L249_1529 [Ophiocordyceps polyrhachis-furcata BCC 54312]